MTEEILKAPQSTNWPKIILAAVFAFALLAASAYAGYWYGTQEISNLKSQISKPQPKTQIPENPTPKPTPTPRSEPVTKGKRFVLKCQFCSSGFSFELPETTTILPEATSVEANSGRAPYWTITSTLGTSIIYYLDHAPMDLDAWFETHSTDKGYEREAHRNPPNAEYFSISDTRKYIIDGEEVIEFMGCYKEPEDICSKPTRLLFQAGGHLWEINEDVYSSASYRKIVDTLEFNE